MRKDIFQAKRIVRECGEIQFPIKVGESAYYRRGKYLVWTDKVKKIFEITSDCVRLETASYYYIIEKERPDAAMLKVAV